MIRSSLEKDFPAKKEGNTNDGHGKNSQEPSSSRPWLGLKDPRIVRVSRSFGGKDRHSKVRTIRGLRDRRIRLSVPTAIQLYDLQERLGLNQPSKAVDWLLNAAQHAIDELSPLQIPPENCAQFSPSVVPHEVLYANTEQLRSNGTQSLTLPSAGKENVRSSNDMYWNSNDTFRAKCKDVEREEIFEKNQEPSEVHSAQKWTFDSLPRPSHSFLTGSLNNVMPYASCYHLELPPNASFSHLGGHGCPSQTEELHNYNTMSLPSSLALPSRSQLLLYPSGTPSIIPSYNITPSSTEFDPKRVTNFQMLSSSSQNLQPNSITASLYSRAFQLNIAPKHHHSHSNHESQSNALEKGTNGSSSATRTSYFLNDSKATLGSNPSSFI